MLDSKLLRHDPHLMAEQLAIKGYSFDVDQFLIIEEQRKRLQVCCEDLQSQKKHLSKQVGILIKNGMNAEQAKASVSGPIAELDQEMSAQEEQLHVVQKQLQALMLDLPNLPDNSVPRGYTEHDNVELLKWGSLPEWSFTPLDHVDVGEPLGLDFAAGTKLTGSRFVVMRGLMAQLHRALIQWMLSLHTQHHGYEEVYTPYLVNEQSLVGTGQLPKFADDLFSVPFAQQHYYLIPTSEVTLANLVRDEIIDLPVSGRLCWVAHTPCFRSEAGSYGRDTRGMIRQHQFDKVELVQVVKPELSWQALEDLCGHAEAVLQGLKLPYRKVALCGGDLGFGAAKTYDLEVWLPGQSAYREISSCSNMTDFQARRMQARWRNPATGKPELVHTLNGSGLAVGRALVAVLENYQQRDGSVRVPDVLQPFIGQHVLSPGSR